MQIEDFFVGIEIAGYTVTGLIDAGMIGKVYLCENNELQENRAIKFVCKDILDTKPQWKSEIIKVNRLKNTEGVVRYHSYGFITIKDVEYLYIFWDYIPSDNLRTLINDKIISIPMLVDVIHRVLDVFHACKIVGIQHSDLHSGNILIQKPDPLSMEPEKRKVWITDFGYGSFSNSIEPLDDYMGFSRIIQDCLSAINFHYLEKTNRHIYNVLKNEFPRYLLETNAILGDYVKNPIELKRELHVLFEKINEVEEHEKNVGDFLAAELIGDRYDEWDSLFVPKFLAIEELLDKNICILTGLRGCGKTMMFRRISYPLSYKLGPAGFAGEKDFIGFYMNARHIAEAFPWLPEKFERAASEQVINFFHLRWTLEIFTWIRNESIKNENMNLNWVTSFFKQYFPGFFFTALDSGSMVSHIISFLQDELHKAKLQDSYDINKVWPLVNYDYLECLISSVQANIGSVQDRVFYFFLDDYSTPIVTYTTQRILNQIIFRRCATAIFKVSTESIESFFPRGLNDKVLEDGADYKLIDLSSELLLKDVHSNEVSDIIDSIFERRIARSSLFADKKINLKMLLGKNDMSDNDRALQIRDNRERVLYYGFNNFCSIWSSDIRELISIFADMIANEGKISIQKKMSEVIIEPVIEKERQNKIFRDAGGKYLQLLGASTNPSHYSIEREPINASQSYGAHLIDIVKAFQEIAYYDLTTKNSKNQGANPPKQPRKIELTSANGELTAEAKEYYRGLIRYGVFLQDNRAKSVRGTVASRLYFRSLLIPYFCLTFSKRDSIMLDWDEFSAFLLTPNDFVEIYKKKNQSYNAKQINMDSLT